MKACKYSYTLIFLFFAAPQLIRWNSNPGMMRLFGRFGLILILGILYLGALSPHLAYADEALNWLLFILLGAGLLHTAPPWARRFMFLPGLEKGVMQVRTN